MVGLGICTPLRSTLSEGRLDLTRAAWALSP